jgi:hypothetical protein
MNKKQELYRTGFIPCSDWTIRHFGNEIIKNNDSFINHNLNKHISELDIEFNISKDGKFVYKTIYYSGKYNKKNFMKINGLFFEQINDNIIIIESDEKGIPDFKYRDDIFFPNYITTEDWFYEIIIKGAK